VPRMAGRLLRVANDDDLICRHRSVPLASPTPLSAELKAISAQPFF
jgi:hypothetical protein